MDAIRECCERAGEHEVQIRIQNHHDIGMPTRSLYHLIEEIDHPNLVNYEEASPPGVQTVPMGEGDLPYETFFKALQNAGYDGWVSYEMCSSVRGGGTLDNLEQYAKTFLEYMRGLKTYNVAIFREDITAPVGSRLCADWKEPAVGVTDPCYALGIVSRVNRKTPVNSGTIRKQE